MSLNRTTEKLGWLVFFPIGLLIFALWLPFGFSLNGLIEEWGILRAFDVFGAIFFTHLYSPLAAHALRPLTVFPQALAYFLDSNSFFYWHVLLIVSLLIKGGATTKLVWQATNSKRFAMFAGLLIIVYPADTMQLSMRALHINWALSCLLLASTLFVSAFLSEKSIKALFLAFISAGLLWISIAMYEASLALSLLPFFIIYAKEGWQNCWDQRYRAKSIIAVWILGIVLYLLYVAIVAPRIDSYQQSFMTDQSLLATLDITLPKLFSPGLTHSLFGGWIDAVQMVYKEISYLGYVYLLLVTSLIFSLIVYFFNLKNNEEEDGFAQQRAGLTRLAVVGILLSLLGYIPFLVSYAHTMISQRTYLFSAPGAVLFWISLLLLLAQWKNRLATGLTIFLVSIGFGMQLFQFHHYLEISERQRTVLRNIVANFDGNLNKKTLILLDGSNQLTSTWMLLLEELQAALSYFYEKPILTLEVCYTPENEWHNTAMRTGSCIEQEKKWMFHASRVGGLGATSIPDKEILKTEAIVLTIKPDGSIESDHLLNDYRLSLNQNKRYQQVLAPKPWPDHFKQFWVSNMEKYQWSFGNWWSMEIPIRGSGWTEAQWNENRYNYRASSWKTQKNSSLLFDLLPRKSTYALRGKFDVFASMAVRNSIQIFLNDHLVSHQWLSFNNFSAEISDNILLSGVNRLRFYSTTEPSSYDLSFTLAKVELFPIKQSRKES
ncbi:MAG: hypothetical protein H0U70_06695 [Tatlockia sp.]|nr:hypothetical protein [Tatlockia sp.]